MGSKKIRNNNEQERERNENGMKIQRKRNENGMVTEPSRTEMELWRMGTVWSKTEPNRTVTRTER